MIIGFAGRKQVGKNTAAKMWQYLSSYDVPECIDDNVIDDFKLYCKDNLQNSWKLKAYAGAIKEIISKMTGCSLIDLDDGDFKNAYVSKDSKTTYRQLLQIIGTDIGRNLIGPNVWVNILMKEYDNDTQEMVPREAYEYLFGSTIIWEYAPKWLITDVRFPNEIKAIKDRRGIVIKVLRDIDSDDHESEEALNNYHDYDYVIRNFGCLKELMVSVSNILKREKMIRGNYRVA